jgi:ankyrin repeat protein
MLIEAIRCKRLPDLRSVPNLDAVFHDVAVGFNAFELTALEYAAATGFEAAVNALIQAGASLLGALNAAARHGNVRTCKLLIEAGANDEDALQRGECT